MSNPTNNVSDTRGDLPAGPTLDNLVAQHVFGWPAPVYITDEGHDENKPLYAWRECHRTHEEFETCDHEWSCGSEDFFPAPNYSTDIRAAWDVVEKLDEKKFFVQVQRLGDRRTDGDYHMRWGCAVWPTNLRAEAETAPLAICLAALKAVAT